MTSEQQESASVVLMAAIVRDVLMAVVVASLLGGVPVPTWLAFAPLVAPYAVLGFMWWLP